jgi:hypothetical protein
MRKQLILTAAAALLAAAMPGCGGDDSEIPASEYAPKPADMDAMREMMDKSAKIKAPKKAG